MTIINGMARFVLTATSVAIASTATAHAQTSTLDPHWQAWVGCWKAATPGPNASSTTVCLVPGSRPSIVDVVTVDSAKVVSRYSVDASGARRTVDREGCTGWEEANWSRDSLRVFLRSDLTCGTGVHRTSTGIMSVSASGDWVDVQAVTAGGNELVRAVRYVNTSSVAGLPAEVATAIPTGRQLAGRTAQLAAGARFSSAAIVEASKAVDTSAVQAWLMESKQQFAIDARGLVQLADAGVPGAVTDMVVALAYPDKFHFDRTADETGPFTRADSARIASEYLGRRGLDCDPLQRYSPFGWGIDPCYGSRYGLYGYGYGYGYNRYGYGSYGGYYDPYSYGYYTRPIVIVRGAEPEHGVAVKGRGYTRPSSGSSGGAAESGRTSSAPASSSGSSAGSSGSSSSGSSSSGSSSGRTARTRPPGGL